MSSPYVCRACLRLRLLRHLPARFAPLSNVRNLTTHVQHDTGNLRGERGEPASNGLAKNSHKNDGNETMRGRYSGKELSPEELLSQLDQPWEARIAAGRSRPRYQNLGRRPKPFAPKRGVTLPTALAAGSRSFIACVNAQDFGRAWSALEILGQECERETEGRSVALLGLPDFAPSMRTFLWACIRQWLRSLEGGGSDSSLPPPKDAFRVLHSVGISKSSFIRPALWQAASGICEARARGASPAVVLNAAYELTEMWRLCIALEYKRRNREEMIIKSSTRTLDDVRPSGHDETDWCFLPPLDGTTNAERTPFADMLNTLMPISKVDLQHAKRSDYASAALLTLDLLREVKAGPENVEAQPLRHSTPCAPFVALLESMLSATEWVPIPVLLEERLAYMEDQVLKTYYAALVHRLQLKPTELSNTRTPTQRSGLPVQPVDLTATVESSQTLTEKNKHHDPAHGGADQIGSTHEERFVKTNIRRLGRATEQKDMYMVEKVRREVYAYAGTRGDLPSAALLELYEHLMLAFLTLRNPRAAIEVWNDITRAGYDVTVKTYTVMMRGAQASRDASGMEAFWQKMRKAGHQPDQYAWSVRIYGLLKLKLTRQGLSALQEMGQEWLTAAKAKGIPSGAVHGTDQPEGTSAPDEAFLNSLDSVEGIPRPNIVVMNSAVSALALTADEHIPKVLTWGRSLGIEPDVNTYNTLLNIAMRHAQADEALNILRRMHQRGIKANSTTSTVLLTALFQGGFLEGVEPPEQQTKILQFVDSLGDRGSGMPGMDEKAYALVIDRLIKFHNNVPAAKAVLEHMTAKGMTPSTHIYTILISSYFQKQPKPDLAAVETLWTQLQAQNSGYGAPVDNVFYDRMIEGYATHHRLAGLQPALGFLKRARQAGQKPGWTALEAVARALAERQDWNRLRALVDEVRRSLREARGATQHMGQRNFWRFIIETGLMKDEGITSPEQFMPSKARESPLLRV